MCMQVRSSVELIFEKIFTPKNHSLRDWKSKHSQSLSQAPAHY